MNNSIQNLIPLKSELCCKGMVLVWESDGIAVQDFYSNKYDESL